jgi:hypothetical protein
MSSKYDGRLPEPPYPAPVSQDDYDALAAERDALSKDAERYRWLRDSAGNDIMEKLMAECSPPRWDELVDAAIDAAMGERP